MCPVGLLYFPFTKTNNLSTCMHFKIFIQWFPSKILILNTSDSVFMIYSTWHWLLCITISPLWHLTLHANQCHLSLLYIIVSIEDEVTCVTESLPQDFWRPLVFWRHLMQLYSWFNMAIFYPLSHISNFQSQWPTLICQNTKIYHRALLSFFVFASLVIDHVLPKQIGCWWKNIPVHGFHYS